MPYNLYDIGYIILIWGKPIHILMWEPLHHYEKAVPNSLYWVLWIVTNGIWERHVSRGQLLCKIRTNLRSQSKFVTISGFGHVKLVSLECFLSHLKLTHAINIFKLLVHDNRNQSLKQSLQTAQNFHSNSYRSSCRVPVFSNTNNGSRKNLSTPACWFHTP